MGTPKSGSGLLLKIMRETHKLTRDPQAPVEVHDWEEITLPCTMHIQVLPAPVLWHPDGHEGIRCRECGVVIDMVLSGLDPLMEKLEAWGYE